MADLICLQVEYLKHTCLNHQFSMKREKKHMESLYLVRQFDQMSIYRQMGGSATITGFGLPLIDGNTTNKIVTLQANETG